MNTKTSNTELVGKRVKMIKMIDPNPILPNTEGTIIFVDSMNHYHVKWDDGRTLAILPEEDEFEFLD